MSKQIRKVILSILCFMMAIGSTNLMRALNIVDQTAETGKYYNQNIYEKEVQTPKTQVLEEPVTPEVQETSEMTLDEEMALDGFKEDESKRTEDTKVYVKDDIEKQIMYLEPVHELVNGTYQPINNDWEIKSSKAKSVGVQASVDNDTRAININGTSMSVEAKEVETMIEVPLNDDVHVEDGIVVYTELTSGNETKLLPTKDGYVTRQTIDEGESVSYSYKLEEGVSAILGEGNQSVYFEKDGQVITSINTTTYRDAEGIVRPLVGEYALEQVGNQVMLSFTPIAGLIGSYPVDIQTRPAVYGGFDDASGIIMYNVRQGSASSQSAGIGYHFEAMNQQYAIIGAVNSYNQNQAILCPICVSNINYAIVRLKGDHGAFRAAIGDNREIVSAELNVTNRTLPVYSRGGQVDAIMLNPEVPFDFSNPLNVTYNTFEPYLNNAGGHQYVGSGPVAHKEWNSFDNVKINIKDAAEAWYALPDAQRALMLTTSGDHAVVLSNETDAWDYNDQYSVEDGIIIPYIKITSKKLDPIPNDYDIHQTKLNVRPFTVNKRNEGTMAFSAIGFDGITQPGSEVQVRVLDTSNNQEVYNSSTVAFGGNRVFPYYQPEFYPVAEGMQRYYKLESNYQLPVWMINNESIRKDALYQIEYRYKQAGGDYFDWVKSDTFQVFKSQGFDRLDRVAAFYGVSDNKLMLKRDNNTIADILVQHNVIIIRNPKQNQGQPYHYTELSDLDKQLIDYNLLGLNKHCEYGYEPINLNTGNFYYSNTDLTFFDYGTQYMIERHYNSMDPGIDGIMGRQWNLGIEQRLAFKADGSIWLLDGTGRILTFVKQADGTYATPFGETMSLSKVVDHTDSRVIDIDYYDQEEAPKQTTEYYDVYHYIVKDENGYVSHFDDKGQLLTKQIDEFGHLWSFEYNEVGNLVKFTSGSQKVFTLEYNLEGYVSKINAPDATSVHYSYDIKGNLIKFVDQGNLAIDYKYEGSKPHLMTSFTDREKHETVVQNTFDDKGRIVKQIDALNQTVTFSYQTGYTEITGFKGEVKRVYFDDYGYTTKVEVNGQVEKQKSYNDHGQAVSMSNSLNQATQYGYDGQGRMISETNHLNETRTYEYNAEGLVSKIIGFNSLPTVFEYNSNKQLVKVIHPDGKEEIKQYNGDGQLTYERDLYGKESWFEYAFGDLTFERHSDGTSFSYVNNALGIQITKSNGDGVGVSYVYDARGLVVEERHAGYTIYNTYDGNGNLVSKTNGNGHITTYEYDNWSRLIAQTDAYGTKRYSYDELGNISKTTDELGNVTVSEYNALNQLVQSTDTMNRTTQYEYDSLGRKVKEINPIGQVRTFEYDINSQLTKEVFEGLEKVYVYDARGRMIESMDEYQNHSTTSYDALGRVSSTTGNGVVTTYEYNGLQKVSETSLGITKYFEYNPSQQLQSESQNGHIKSQYTYNQLGLISLSTSGQSITTEYGYDVNYRLVKEVDANGAITSYEYDFEGNQTKVIDALGHETVKTYSARNHVLSEVGPTGIIKTYEYNALGQVVKEMIQDPETSETIETRHSYQADGSKLESIDSIGRKTSYTYDALGRMIEENFEGRKTINTYNNLGQLIKVENYQDTVMYEYDVRGLKVKEISEVKGETLYEYNEQRLNTKTTNPYGLSTENIYDTNQRLITSKDVRGLEMNYVYNDLGQKIEEIDLYGQSKQYVYNGLGQVSSMNINGIEVTTQFDATGRPIENTMNSARYLSMSYDLKGQLVSETNALGQTSSKEYDALGRVVKEVSANGATTSKVYDYAGNVIVEVDAMGSQTQYRYDKANRLIETIDALGFSQKTHYDIFNRKVSETNQKNQTTSYEYDQKDRLIKEIRPDGIEISYGYDAKGRKVLSVDALGNQTHYIYNELDQLIKQIQPNGLELDSEYNEYGDLLVSKDDLGVTKKYQYDKYGRVMSEFNELNNETTYEYNDKNQLVQVNYPGGLVEYTTYDALGRKASVVDTRGINTTYTYNEIDQVIQTVNSLGITTQTEYDAVGNVIKTSDGLHVSRYEYDLNNRQVKEIHVDGTFNETVYDKLGRVTKAIDENNQREHFYFDALGQVTKQINANGQIIRTAYNNQNKVWKTTNELGHILEYNYDKGGNQTEILYQNEKSRTFKYNESGQLLTVKDIDGIVESYKYDQRNRQVHYTHEGQMIESSYNELNQVVTQTSKDDIRHYAYNALGQMIEVSSDAGTSMYIYDVYGQLLETTDVNEQTIQYTYDQVGNQTSIVYPNGKVVSYTYNVYQEMISMTSPQGVTTYSYNDKGLLTSKQLNSLKTSYQYDNKGQLIGLVNENEDGLVSRYHYRLDGLGQILSEYEESNNHHQATYYLYDDANQLIESRIVQDESDDIVVNYQYDLYGNKTTETTIQGEAESVLKYVYSEGKQLKAIESEEGNITYKYNKQGNVISKTTDEQTETFEYTGFNQLSKITNDLGIETEYEYDGLGSRVSKTVYTDYEYIYRYFKPVINSQDQIKETFNQQVEDMIEALGDFEDGSTCELLVEGKQDRIKRESYTYVSDITKENEQVLVETQNKKETSYYYGIDRAGKTEELLNKVKEEQYLYNGSSDVVQLIQGSSIRYYEYDDSGRSSLIEGYGYRSEYHESGYQYLRFRYLDIDSGRFMSKDSYLGNEDPVSQNRYTYVGNNPINYSDPTGHWWNPLKAIKDGFDAVVDVGAKVVNGIVDVGLRMIGYDKELYDQGIKVVEEKVLPTINTVIVQPIVITFMNVWDQVVNNFGEVFKDGIVNLFQALTMATGDPILARKMAEQACEAIGITGRIEGIDVDVNLSLSNMSNMSEELEGLYNNLKYNYGMSDSEILALFAEFGIKDGQLTHDQLFKIMQKEKILGYTKEGRKYTKDSKYGVQQETMNDDATDDFWNSAVSQGCGYAAITDYIVLECFKDPNLAKLMFPPDGIITDKKSVEMMKEIFVIYGSQYGDGMLTYSLQGVAKNYINMKTDGMYSANVSHNDIGTGLKPPHAVYDYYNDYVNFISGEINKGSYPTIAVSPFGTLSFEDGDITSGHFMVITKIEAIGNDHILTVTTWGEERKISLKKTYENRDIEFFGVDFVKRG